MIKHISTLPRANKYICNYFILFSILPTLRIQPLYYNIMHQMANAPFFKKNIRFDILQGTKQLSGRTGVVSVLSDAPPINHPFLLWRKGVKRQTDAMLTYVNKPLLIFEWYSWNDNWLATTLFTFSCYIFKVQSKIYKIIKNF